MPTSTTQVSIGELIRLAFPAGTLMPPPRFRSRLVNWVTMAGPGIVPAAGDFLLCGDCPQPDVLAAWVRAGAAGLAASGALTAVEKLDLPVIALLQECEPADVLVGMRVEAVWRPRAEWTTTFENIRHFRPTGEPDVPVERLGAWV